MTSAAENRRENQDRSTTRLNGNDKCCDREVTRESEQHTKRLTMKPNPQSADLHTPIRSKTPFLYETQFAVEHCVDNAEHPFMPLVSLE